MKTVCGLDIHKDTIFACVLKEDGTRKIKEFLTLTPDLYKLKMWIKKEDVLSVAMESTGVYWMPIWHVLEELSAMELLLVNPYFIKQIPGRKTDIKDAQWIATLLMKGLLRGSFIPDKHIRELREYERRYVKLCGKVNGIEQELDRQLAKCNIRIASLTSRIGSLTVFNVLRALIDGETNPKELEKLVHGRVRNRHGKKVRASLTGTIAESDLVILRQIYRTHQLFKEQQEELLSHMEIVCDTHYKKEIDLLCTIPGIQKNSAMQIIAEIGFDMKNFATAASICGWGGLRPRNDESAGKIKSKKIIHGNKYIRRILVQCAWAASRTKGSFFKWKFDQLCKRKSSKKALIAIARKMLVVIWNILKKQTPYVHREVILSPEQKERKLQYYRQQIDEILTY